MCRILDREQEAIRHRPAAPPALEVNRCPRALYKAWVYDGEGALDELAADVESRPLFMIDTPRSPAFARLRVNPRFFELVGELAVFESVSCS